MYPLLGFPREYCTVRDPIHGDIPHSLIERSVVDTRVFQRLRYIRQNGLLHLVFPGAVHTRFAHSLGTMHIAGCVARSLFGGFERSEEKAVNYLTLAFRLAGLLHDIGHCGFSHSVEGVKGTDGNPLLRTTRELFANWQNDNSGNGFQKQTERGNQKGEIESFVKDLEKCSPQTTMGAPTEHEEIGLLLTFVVFSSEEVRKRCAAEDVEPDDLGKDVRALIHGHLPYSDRFAECAVAIARCITDHELEDPARDMLSILHSLVSGTLDVDRLDYLNRDSLHCGVTYGSCQTDLLVKCLSLASVSDEIKLLLNQKAAHALDDMLWSRYQLFLQVLNHKTNVGLNTALGEALLEAKRDGRIDLPGQSFTDFVSFTDGYVYGTLFKLAQEAPAAVGRPFIRVLVDRKILTWIKEERLPADQKQAAEEEDRLTKEFREDYPDKEPITKRAESFLLKLGPLPLLGSKRGEEDPILFHQVSSVVGLARESLVPSGVYRVLHFFVQRD